MKKPNFFFRERKRDRASRGCSEEQREREETPKPAPYPAWGPTRGSISQP